MWHSPKNKKNSIKFKELNNTKKTYSERFSFFATCDKSKSLGLNRNSGSLNMFLNVPVNDRKKIFFQSFTEKKIPSNYLHKVAVSYN